MNKMITIEVQLLLILALLTGCTGKTGSQKEADETSEYYTMSDFQSVPKIDIHAHINVEGQVIIDEARANNFKLLVMAVDVVPDYPPMDEQIRVRKTLHEENPDVFAYTTAFTLEGWDEPGWSDKVIKKLK